MGIEYAFGIAAMLLVTYVSFLFLFKVKEVTVTNKNQPRKRIFTVPPTDPDPQRKLANDLIMSRLGLTRDDGCVITISVDKQTHHTVESVGNSLSVLNSFATVFLLLQATTDDEENRSYEQFSALNISNPIARHRFLFYQTQIGKIAMIRQLKSQLHVDFEATVCKQIAPHIKSTVHIDENDHKSPSDMSMCRKIRSLDELILATSQS